MQDPLSHEADQRRSAERIFVPGFWGALSIIAMWLAVLFDGIFGDQLTITNSPTNVVTMPSVMAVALFAAIGTAAVAKRAFARRNSNERS